MKHHSRILPVLLLMLATVGAQEMRTFTNAAGKSIQARLVGIQGANVTIEMANGQKSPCPPPPSPPQTRSTSNPRPHPFQRRSLPPTNPDRMTSWSLPP